MTPKIFLLLGLVVLASADLPSYSYSSPETYSAEYDPPKYRFDWVVKDDNYGNHYGHHESREYDHTKGSYWVLLPDYRHKTVTYYVDGDSGFVADVRYDGDNHYSEEYYEEYEPPKSYHG